MKFIKFDILIFNLLCPDITPMDTHTRVEAQFLNQMAIFNKTTSLTQPHRPARTFKKPCQKNMRPPAGFEPAFLMGNHQ